VSGPVEYTAKLPRRVDSLVARSILSGTAAEMYTNGKPLRPSIVHHLLPLGCPAYSLVRNDFL
jgi:hypothetical protein